MEKSRALFRNSSMSWQVEQNVTEKLPAGQHVARNRNSRAQCHLSSRKPSYIHQSNWTEISYSHDVAISLQLCEQAIREASVPWRELHVSPTWVPWDSKRSPPLPCHISARTNKSMLMRQWTDLNRFAGATNRRLLLVLEKDVRKLKSKLSLVKSSESHDSTTFFY